MFSVSLIILLTDPLLLLNALDYIVDYIVVILYTSDDFLHS